LAIAVGIEPRIAHAYLDPGTGSMLLSAILSIFVTIGLGIQAYGYKILGWLRTRRLAVTEPEPQRSDEGLHGHERQDEP